MFYQLRPPGESMLANADIKSRITFSQTLLPLNDGDLEQYIVKGEFKLVLS